MKNCILVMLMMVVLPAAAWAQEPSNEELYQMIKAMERKFDTAIEATRKAQAEADKAREEAAAARAETAKAKEELAQLKSEKSAAAPAAQAADKHLLHVSATNPGFTASVEAIYLRPSRSDLDFVIKDPYRTGNVRGTVGEIEPDYQLGARFGLGYDFGSGMEIGVRFAGLKSHDNESVTRSTGEDLWGIWLHANSVIDDNDVTTAKARYDFEHYAIDLGARQKLDLGQRLGLSLEAGLRYASMNQDIHIYYEQEVTPLLRRSADISNENDFSGWGPRLGAGLDWRVGYGFKVFGSVAGSLLMGDFDLSYRELDLPVGATTPTRRVDIKQGIRNRVIPVVETKVGVGYAYQLQNGWAFGANAGYEWQNWFNMVTAQRFSDDVDGQIMSTDTTDIGLDGFFLEAFVNF
jgi:hypothetical protein